MSGDLIQSIGRFEDGDEGGGLPWLGGPRGVVIGLLLTLGAAVLLALSVVAMFAIGEHIVSKLICAFMLIVVAAVTAYWRRQRLAAHYEAAQRLVESADPDKRQSGFTELMVNARRGRAEHRRIAATLTAYLRRPPHDQPNETGRRQLVLTLLADFTLSPLAKERLDLSGASLAGLRAVNAELPGVCLRDADLSNVRFARANLAYADLVGARLEGADFTGARLEGTILAPSALARRYGTRAPAATRAAPRASRGSVMAARAVDVPVFELLGRRVAHVDHLHLEVQRHVGQRVVGVDGDVVAFQRLDRRHDRPLLGAHLQGHARFDLSFGQLAPRNVADVLLVAHAVALGRRHRRLHVVARPAFRPAPSPARERCFLRRAGTSSAPGPPSCRGRSPRRREGCNET